MDEKHAQVIGVDLGTRRVGVAISDEAGLFAHPLCVIPYTSRDQVIQRLVELAESRGADVFVVGLPRNMDGTIGESGRRSINFARKLERSSKKTVVLWDERLTTSQAEKEMIALDRSRRRRRMTIDEASAVLILESYLRQRGLLRNSMKGSDPDEQETPR